MLSPAVIDGVVLGTIRASKDSYLGIKWLAENSYSGKRDLCFVEMVGYTINSTGQEIGFIATASVDVPECPELSRIIKLTRVRMKRTMLVIPSADAPKVTSEVFVMGASEANESSIVAHLQYHLSMTRLNDISLVIDSQNITKQTLILKKDWILNENRPSCTICTRKFQKIYHRRHHCRMCGDVVCKTCYVTRSVSASTIQRSRKRILFPNPSFAYVVSWNCAPLTTTKEFSSFASKLLSQDMDSVDTKIPSTEAILELPSPDSNSRASSFSKCSKYCNAGINNPVLDINQLRRTSLDEMNVDADKKRQLRTDNIAGFGAMVSVGSWNS